MQRDWTRRPVGSGHASNRPAPVQKLSSELPGLVADARAPAVDAPQEAGFDNRQICLTQS
jgi:hypothetical protein